MLYNLIHWNTYHNTLLETIAGYKIDMNVYINLVELLKHHQNSMILANSLQNMVDNLCNEGVKRSEILFTLHKN